MERTISYQELYCIAAMSMWEDLWKVVAVFLFEVQYAFAGSNRALDGPGFNQSNWTFTSSYSIINYLLIRLARTIPGFTRI